MRLSLTILVALLLAALAPSASADTYLLIVDGNDITVNSYSFGTSSSGSGGSVGGSGSSSSSDLMVNIDVGSYSSGLESDSAMGKILNPVILEIFSPSATATLTLTDAIISSISFGSGISGTPTEDVTFVFRSETVDYSSTGSGGTGGGTNVPEPSTLALLAAGLASLLILSTRKLF